MKFLYSNNGTGTGAELSQLPNSESVILCESDSDETLVTDNDLVIGQWNNDVRTQVSKILSASINANLIDSITDFYFVPHKG